MRSFRAYCGIRECEAKEICPCVILVKKELWAAYKGKHIFCHLTSQKYDAFDYDRTSLMLVRAYQETL